MSQGLTTLRRRLEELRVAGTRLGRALRTAALDLDAAGVPLSAGLLDELRRYRGNVESLRLETVDVATELATTERPSATSSLGELSAILRRAEDVARRREAARRVANDAVERLDRIESLHCADDPQSGPLRAVHEEARRLRADIEGSDADEASAEAEALASDRHPLCGLLTLVGGAEGIDDDRWGALLDEVTERYGRGLSAAVARGKVKAGAVRTRPAPAKRVESEKPSDGGGARPSEASAGNEAARDSATLGKEPHSGDVAVPTKAAPGRSKAQPAKKVTATATPGPSGAPSRAEPERTPKSGAPATSPTASTAPAPGDASTASQAVPPEKAPAASAEAAPKAASAVPAAAEAPASKRGLRDRSVAAPADRTADRPVDRSAGRPGSPKPAVPRIDLDEGAADGKAGVGDAVIMKGSTGPRTVGASKTVAGAERVLPRKLNTIPLLAQAALDVSGAERHQHVSTLIWKLCLEGRLGVAGHLARCLEKRADVGVVHLPSTLLHALCLAPHVQFGTGETARQLADDFGRLRFASGPRNDAEWAVAWQLLLTAAALRPALLAPNCGASGLLHNMRMIEGLSRLYNYTHRIAIFADSGRSLDVNAFKRARSEQAWEIDLDQFLAEVDAWCGQTPMRRLRYSATTHCFLKSHWSVSRGAPSAETRSRAMWRIWQSTLDRLHALLEPVRRNEVEARDAVRAETDLLSDPSEIDLLTSGVQFGRKVAANVDAASREQLRLVISEAVGLARRWLRIHDTPPERRTPAVPRRAEELLEERRAVQLRDEVISRQDGVLKELKAVSERYASAPIVTAIACCCRSIEQIRRLFDPDEPVATDETDPRLLFNSELLRVPSLALNDSWEPDAGPNELENDLLQLLTRGAPDWRQAFEERSDEGDHEATERLLLLPVWPAEGEQETLIEIREQKLEQCRQALLRDVDATRARVAEASTLGLIEDRDRDDFDSEISAVESSGRTAQRFPPWHRRLSEIREVLERRRQYEIQKVRERFDLLKLQQGDPYNVRIDAALNDGNLVRANRYIDMAATGQPLGEEDWVR